MKKMREIESRESDGERERTWKWRGLARKK